MTLWQLLAALSECPSDPQVYVWLDGQRYPIADVDLSFVVSEGFVDLNATPDV